MSISPGFTAEEIRDFVHDYKVVPHGQKTHWLFAQGVSYLTKGEREEISRGLAADEGIREIARRLSRDASVISREISRNKGASKYRAGDADDRAYRLARRPKPCTLALNSDLRDYVDQQLREDWSPEQIAGTLKKHSPVGKGVHVSHETIYKSLFIQSRGVLAKDLQQHLRSGRPIRRNVHNTTTKQWRSQIPDAVSIHDRPKSVDQRRRAGHWESQCCCQAILGVGSW